MHKPRIDHHMPTIKTIVEKKLFFVFFLSCSYRLDEQHKVFIAAAYFLSCIYSLVWDSRGMTKKNWRKKYNTLSSGLDFKTSTKSDKLLGSETKSRSRLCCQSAAILYDFFSSFFVFFFLKKIAQDFDHISLASIFLLFYPTV